MSVVCVWHGCIDKAFFQKSQNYQYYYLQVISFEADFNEVAYSNICSIKFRSNTSTNTKLCLLRNLMEQTLFGSY